MRKFPACVPSSLGDVGRIVDRAQAGERLSVEAIARLFAARGGEIGEVVHAADTLRRKVSGETVRYVVNRNINYTNICEYKCAFCAFSKGKTADNLRGKPYNLSLDEVARRAAEAWERGATEVCMQGGIHPSFDGSTYLSLLRAVKDAVPGMHVHAFSPLEVWHGAHSVGETLPRYLERLRDAGLGSLPGTAAEILDDDVRAVLCPDKLNTAQWLAVVEAAHQRRSAHDCHHHVRPYGDSRRIGRVICSTSAIFRNAPAASPSSCRCRSFTARRRLIIAARPARGRPRAKPS